MKALSYFLFLTTILLSSCKKEGGSTGGGSPSPKIPTLTTTAGSAVTATTAQSGGTITSDGGSPITARGVCWSVVTPTIANSKTTDGSGTGIFVSALTNLFPYTFYEVRAYATNSVGTGYGDVVTIITTKVLTVPVLTTDAVTAINHNSAFMSGEVTSDGNATVTARGVCYSTTQNPTIANTTIQLGSGIGGFFTSVPGLAVNTTYYVRTYATNSIGTGYGNQVSFTAAFIIGNAYQGGRIFFVDNTKLHGLITATNDQSAGARWNNTSNPYANVNAYSVDDGVANTNTMISVIGNTGNAAAVCRAYTGGGYTDWYLPSINELYKLYLQKTIIGNFQPVLYWSSTASSTFNANAWAQHFGNGSSYNDRDKTELNWVRAIRRF